ncbi:MAG: heavy-metal-associated domain-containing protein [Segniliparus sp.]|uniref:heavy-metal-associated domain-containing protein n=1 Tax=Segniliparus sp. TaxID=2804064 RepID=UPI003F2AD6C9
MTSQSYHVVGMTCGHCASAVREGLASLTGVSDVAVNLETGEVRVASAAPLDDARVREAVAEAGYELA